MATFTIRCKCGEPFHVDDAAIGRHVVCRRCGTVTEVQRPAATKASEAGTARAHQAAKEEP